MMNVICVDPRTDWQWQTLIDQQPSCVFHSPAWMRVMGDAYEMEPHAYVVMDGQPRAGIAFCHLQDISGERITTRPFSDYCDPLANEAELWCCLSDQLIAAGCPVTVRCLHNEVPLSDPRFRLVNRARWHQIDLRRDVDVIWQSLDPAARRAIKKAKNSGVELHIAQHKRDLRAFYNLHLRIRKYKYHLLAQPYRFFDAIWDQFVEPGNGILIVAAHKKTVIGGIFFLRWGDTMYYKFNASDPGYLDCRPNDLMLWVGIQQAITAGCNFLDFGLSDWDQDGLVRYKRKYATSEGTISFLRYTPPDYQPNDALWSLFGKITDLLTDISVPDAVTERGGDVMYCYFA